MRTCYAVVSFFSSLLFKCSSFFFLVLISAVVLFIAVALLLCCFEPFILLRRVCFPEAYSLSMNFSFLKENIVLGCEF